MEAAYLFPSLTMTLDSRKTHICRIGKFEEKLMLSGGTAVDTAQTAVVLSAEDLLSREVNEQEPGVLHEE